MINLEFNDLPVKPAVEGTYELPQRGMFFTIGRDYVEDKLKELLRRRSTLAVDIETFGLGNLRFRIKCVSFADDRNAVILDCRDKYQFHLIKWALAELKGIILQNSSFDAVSLYQRELLRKKDVRKIIDTVITSRQANPGENTRHTLEALSNKYFGFKSEARIKSDEYYHNDLHMVSYIHGAAMDVLCTYKLLPILITEVKKRLSIPPLVKELELTDEEKEYILWREQRENQILLERSIQGLSVDIDEVDKYEQRVTPQRNRVEVVMKKYGMTIQPRTSSYTNANELMFILNREGVVPPKYPKTPTGKYSTTDEDLELLQHPLAEAFRENKKILKVRQYLNAIADEAYRTNRVFPTTNVLGAGTGRFSMSDPPLQQFIPAARPVIVAEEGEEFASIDWSQIEPTLVIYLADDTMAINRYEGGGEDIYLIVGDIAGIERKKAKTTLLAQIYGQGIGKLSMQLGVSESTARDYRDRIFAGLPGVASFIKGMSEVGKSGHVHTLMGRVLDIRSYRGDLKHYTAVNYIVQGSAYDLLAEAIIRIDNAGLSDGLYFTFHDELVISNQYSQEIAEIMRTPPERMIHLLDRTPVIKCDPTPLGRHWQKL